MQTSVVLGLIAVGLALAAIALGVVGLYYVAKARRLMGK